MSSPDIQIEVFGKTDVGLIREHNEDNLLMADLGGALKESELDAPATLKLGEHGALFLVCDGMGGAAAGEVASQMAVDAIFDVLAAADANQPHDAFARSLRWAVEVANERIFQQSRDNQNERGMGTTCTAAALNDDTLVVAQIGDSRCYVFRHGQLGQVTKDQSLAWQLIEAGAMTAEDAKAFEHANIILQALGVQDRVDVVLSQITLRRGDVVVLCSDGLHGPVGDAEIEEILAAESDLKKAGENLLQRALDRDGPDNITVVLARFDGPGLAEAKPEDKVGFLSYDPGRDPSETSPTRAPEPDDRNGSGGAVTSAAALETTEETGVTRPTGGAARRLTRVRSAESGGTAGSTTAFSPEFAQQSGGPDHWPGRALQWLRGLLGDTRGRNGRPVMALFFLALLAATAGGIFVLKCERNQAVHGEDRVP